MEKEKEILLMYRKGGDIMKQRIKDIYIHPSDRNRIKIGTDTAITIDNIQNLYDKETNFYNKKYLYMSCLSLYINDKIMSHLVGGGFQQNGGDDNITHKLNKYSYKYNNTCNHKYNIKYLQYLNKNMIYDFNYISNIINQKGGIYTEYRQNPIENIALDDNLEMVNLSIIDCQNLNQHEKCIVNPTASVRHQDEYLLSNATNILKRYFKGISTDTYMKILYDNPKKYMELTYFVYIHLYLCLAHFIYILNKTDTNYDLSDKHIKLLYKGGNTTRIHLGATALKY